jgi:hypothetical protein
MEFDGSELEKMPPTVVMTIGSQGDRGARTVTAHRSAGVRRRAANPTISFSLNRKLGYPIARADPDQALQPVSFLDTQNGRRIEQ